MLGGNVDAVQAKIAMELPADGGRYFPVQDGKNQLYVEFELFHVLIIV